MLGVTGVGLCKKNNIIRSEKRREVLNAIRLVLRHLNTFKLQITVDVLRLLVKPTEELECLQ